MRKLLRACGAELVLVVLVAAALALAWSAWPAGAPHATAGGDGGDFDERAATRAAGPELRKYDRLMRGAAAD